VPGMQISTEGRTTEELLYEGSWCLSTTPEELAAGKLSIDANSFGLLYLPIGLLPENNLDRHSVIYGTCGSRKFTLFGAERKGFPHNISRTDNNVEGEYWHSGLVIEGAHLNDLDTVRVVFYLFETEHLMDWLNKPFVSDSLNGHQPTLTTEIPEDLHLAVDGLGEFLISWRTWHGHTGQTATIEITPEVKFAPLATLNLIDFLKNVLQPWLNFTSFGLDYSDTSKNVRIEYKTDGGPIRIRLHIGGLLTNPRTMRIYPHEQILPFTKIEADIDLIVKNWYLLSKTQQYPMEEFFSIFHDGEEINERDFPRLVGALESWHSHWKPDLTQIDQAAFATAKAALIQQSDPQIADLLKTKLDNRPFLKTRLIDLIEESSDHIKEAISLVPNFISLCISTRNGMVHVDPDGKVFTRRQKFWAHQILASLFSSLILKQIGIPDSEIDARLDKERGRCVPKYAANYIHGELTAVE
jgi:hypothetical protein